ncbi:hypothetical protein ACFQUU_27265 [Herbaspirillum sp. GCM10030257]|uniref:hypothetical protein n=1 Tax=Herbaspirillum sp. GCM10030257 TaxID=3273393 RepID=UPI00361F12CB
MRNRAIPPRPFQGINRNITLALGKKTLVPTESARAATLESMHVPHNLDLDKVIAFLEQNNIAVLPYAADLPITLNNFSALEWWAELLYQDLLGADDSFPNLNTLIFSGVQAPFLVFHDFLEVLKDVASQQIQDSVEVTSTSTMERLSQRQSYKLVSNRVNGDYPASAGTSRTDYPCLTNALGPCVAVIMTGASDDEKKRNGRIFHVDSRNTKARETLKEYKELLIENGLKQISAILVRGCVTPSVFQKMIPNCSEESANQYAQQGKKFVDDLRELMRTENIPIVRDDAGENRPESVTGESTVGFKLKRDGEKIAFEYLQNVVR